MFGLFKSKNSSKKFVKIRDCKDGTYIVSEYHSQISKDEPYYTYRIADKESLEKQLDMYRLNACEIIYE